jgi:drug/metabolite transporter (DMT)-like permease
MPTTSRHLDAKGAAALLLGATGIGLAPILVRLSETGPVATAFYRILLAQPILWWWLLREKKSDDAKRTSRSDLKLAALAGFFFAGDMAIWNWSLKLTTVANSTLLTNFTPFVVTIAARILFHERIAPRLLTGMSVAFAGGFLLVGESLKMDRRFLIGDGLAIVAAFFYAGYLLTVKQLRRTRSAWYVMAVSGVFSAAILFCVSAGSREVLLPLDARGWIIVLLLALVSHTAGQGLIAYGLAHISASLSSVMLMWQPVVAALLAWMILHEPLTMARAFGGVIIILGIGIATYRR